MPGATTRRASTESDNFKSGSLTGRKIRVTCLGNSFVVRFVFELAVGQVWNFAPVDFIQIDPFSRSASSVRLSPPTSP